jgi:Protein of unknown function (DUF1576)
MGVEVTSRDPKSWEPSDDFKLLVVAIYAASFVVFGLVVDSPEKVFRGLIEILTTRDALLTDYVGVGGIGAAFVNAGLLTLCSCLVYYLSGATCPALRSPVCFWFSDLACSERIF